MENSKIEWCDHTINLWTGCTKVHAGCDHCYAETLSRRWGKDVWGPNLDGSMKIILDCLQKVNAFKNDNKCIKIVAQKFVDKETPRIEFLIKEIV